MGLLELDVNIYNYSDSINVCSDVGDVAQMSMFSFGTCLRSAKCCNPSSGSV